MNGNFFQIPLLIATLGASAQDANLVIAENGKSPYQIVVPGSSASADIAEGLRQTARLMQTAFKANGTEISVTAEDDRDRKKPGIFLGNTAFAHANGVEVQRLKGWGYVQKVVGKNIIIAGHDHSGPQETGNRRRPPWDRIGTVKGVTDFLRQYVGTRFLYPDLSPYQSVKGAARIDIFNSPAIEFLPLSKIAIPAGLDVQHIPPINFNTAHPAGGGFYDLANNRFPRVDDTFGGHTWERAVPKEKYAETHPEYFALLGGKRSANVKGNGQYCISNPEVTELIYQDLCRWLDRGYRSVDLGQPDGFRPCQCRDCEKLFDTGSDWSEKIWIYHRNFAARLLENYPDRQVTIMSYIQTARPPKSFKKFPANTKVMLTGTNEDDIAPWRGHEVPGGFTGYVYNWCPNLCTRYTPMRTPAHVATQVKRLAANRIQSLYRDGPGALYGLEGPVYYTMGRMFDDPENLSAGELVQEFVEAAFGRSAWHMSQFYDQLNHAITLYSDYLGTRSPAWTYEPMTGRRRKTVSDPFRLLGFLYSPSLLKSLESQLASAEQKAKSAKVKTRLALVRREFDYVKNVARVVHLYHAYQVQPDLMSRDRLLDAVAARNAEIESWYDKRGRPVPAADWAYVMFPPPGHNAAHLRLAYNNYQEPFESSVFNWDTKAMRNAPLPGAKRLTVNRLEGKVSLDDPQWTDAAANELVPLSGSPPLTRKTTAKFFFSQSALLVRLKGELPAEAMAKPAEQESIVLYLSPPSPGNVSYRFTVGPRDDSKTDAASGFITDAMDPRHGQYDPDWNGDWKYESRLEPKKNRWLGLITIPFKTLGIEPPAPASFWRGNLGRVHVIGKDQLEQSAWSTAAGVRRMDDRNGFGEMVFAGDGVKKKAEAQRNPLSELRENLYRASFEVPEQWKSLPDPLPTRLTGWVFRADPLNRGIKERWFAPNAASDDWQPMAIPSFWAENAQIGNYVGHGWHRTTFKVPANWTGRNLRLCFGSVDEQAWVYVNGQLVREHSEESEGKSYGELWEIPFTADVPANHLKPGADNVLVVRVHNSKANGGIWRPVLAHAIKSN